MYFSRNGTYQPRENDNNNGLIIIRKYTHVSSYGTNYRVWK